MPIFKINKIFTVKRIFLNLLLIIIVMLPFPGITCAKTLTDEMGRRVELRHNTQRIISLAPGITEIIYSLHLADKLVGVTSFCDWPAAAKQKPQIGGFINPSIEKIISLAPDLILATADGNKKETVRQLERAGLTVYVINPSSTAGILRSIAVIGQITGEQKAAGVLVNRLQKRLDNISTQTLKKNKPRVFFQIGLDPVITAGRGTLIDEAIVLAGGFNIAGGNISRYPRYGAEGIMAGAPEIILFAPMASDKEFTAVQAFWQKFQEIPAVKNNKIYPVETDLISRASPRIIDAIEKMALLFHPELKIDK